MRAAPLLGAGCILVAGMSALVAQTVDGFDVAAAKRAAERQGAEAESFAEQVKSRGEAFRREAERLRVDGLAMLRRSASEKASSPSAPLDLDAMVAAAGANASVPRGDAPQLIVFASLSMPSASLKPLIADTARAGGLVVFRGFPGNSAKALTAGLAAVVRSDRSETGIGIDPRLFRAFGVESVPTVVIASTDFDLCEGFACRTVVPPHDRLSGNVTLQYALETIAGGQGPGARVAQVALARLRGTAR